MDYDKGALRRLMRERDWNDQKVADAAGVRVRTVNYIARGISVPKADTLGKLARALKVNVARFYQRGAA